MKSNVIFMCNSCGNEFAKWSGQCSACHEWNTLVEVTSLTKKSKSHASRERSKPVTPKEALKTNQDQVFSSQIDEFNRVLGEGFTKGGVYLIAGQPGIGKSTLLTQIAINQKSSVLYICSEENTHQVANRIERLSKNKTDHIHLLNTSSTEEIIETVSKDNPDLVIVDSIQSIASEQNQTSAGSPSQIRDCSNLLIQTAKQKNVCLIIVGHVTKEGDIAGPKLLEHMVDVVLELSGDRQHELRILRGIKNRFGPTDETGLFQMTSGGLAEVTDPGKFLLAGQLQNAPGSILAMIMEGTRPLTIEVQALVVDSAIPVPRRVAKGIPANRLQLICAILTKHLHLPIGTKDVFLNITGGLNVTEPGVDLAVALAIISSAKDKPFPANTLCIGELGLLGEIRNVSFLDKRLKEAKKLGYQNIYSPSTHKHLSEITRSK